jgi:peroxiredoxin
MRDDLAPSSPFPDLRLPEHTGEELTLSGIAAGQPLVLCFVRGWWCPKEQVRLRGLVEMQEELQREYGRIAVVTVDEPYVNGAFRAGLGAAFPFLSDEDRRVAEDLELLELTDEKHRPYLPFTFVLDSTLRIHRSWCGFWYWGNPTPDELRLALREVTRAEQPTFDPRRVWSERGSAPPDAGIAGDAVWVREDREGREIARGVHRGDLPAAGDELGRSAVDGRAWVVHEVERDGGRPAIHLRKRGAPAPARLVRHHLTAPRQSG